jgi:aryl-alcohol dehydrogenase-like predicted oxidoreductase
VVALRVLEAGLLAGRAPPAKAPLAQEREATRTRLAEIAPLLGPEPLVHTAVRFALSRPELTTVLVGFSDVAQVEDAVAAAAQGPLPAALLARIEGE